MSFLSSHRLHITPLSPVHIGCNEVYEPTNYIIDEQALYEFSADTAMTCLPEVERQKLLRIVSGKPDAEMLKALQKFFYGHRDVLMAQSGHSFPVGDGVAELYANRIGQTAQHEGRGKQVLNKLEIERCSYNPMDHNPVFPGSSLKGAIRTALLDQINAGAKPNYRESNQALQQRLFNYSMRDLHKDPLRLLSIADAHWSGDSVIPGNEIRFAVNRQRRLNQGARLQQSMAEEKGLYQLLECVSALQSRSLTTTLNLAQVKQLSQKYADKLPAASLQFSIRDIAQACNDFYHTLWQQEQRDMQQMGYLDPKWQALSEQILSGSMRQRLQNNEAFLVRLGRHSGAEALTLNGVRSIKIMKGNRGKPQYEAAPHTWWLAASDTDSQGSMMPFGWVLVEIDTDESEPFPAQTELDAFNRPRQRWFDAQQSRQRVLQDTLATAQATERERLATLEAERVKQQAQQQREAEQQATEAADREAVLAQLQPIEREIAEFPVVLDAIKALQAGQWNGADQQQAASYLKARMQQEKLWKDSSAKKNPAKDKDYQRTLIVISFLAAQ